MKRKFIGSTGKSYALKRRMVGWDVGDMHAFNLAMLAKKACTLFHNFHSLFCRVYKAQYFPDCSFMMVGLENNPSFVWRSLLAVVDATCSLGSTPQSNGLGRRK